MKTARFICCVLAAALSAGCGGCVGNDAPSGSAPTEAEGYAYDACLIEKRDTDVSQEYWYVYIDSGTPEESGLCGIPVQETAFISHDQDLQQLDDAEPGMMIRFTVPEDYQDLLEPGYFNKTLSIETWGEYREDLYRTGLDRLEELQ